MFKRVDFADWQPVLTVVVFFITLIAFLYFTWRALRMKKEKREHMANLPLESDSPAAGQRDDQAPRR